MSSNESLLRKADIAIADLQANGGELNPEQGASFIRKLIKQPTLIRQCRVVEMNASSRKINKIGFGTRILRKATSGVALTEAQRSKPSTEQIELNTKEQVAEVRLPYDVLEDTVGVEFRVTVNRDDDRPALIAEEVLTVIKRVLTDNRSWGGLAVDTKRTGNEIDMTTYGDRSVVGVCFCEVMFRHSHLDPRNENSDV